MSRRDKRGRDAVSRRLTESLSQIYIKKSNRKFRLRFEKEETSTEDKRRRLRRLVPSWSFLTRLRRPHLFSRKRKDGGRKECLDAVWCFLPLNSGKHRGFGLAFHSRVTLRASWYAPPDTGASSLRLVALERLPSIEGMVEIRRDFTFLRGTPKAPLCKGSCQP